MRVLVRTISSLALLSFSANWATAQPKFLFATALSPLVQNARADEDGLSRIADQADLRRFVQSGLLVPVPAEARHYYVKGVAAQYRYLRPWSKQFLTRIGSQYYAKFHKRLRVTSMVRTTESQIRLASYNGNAAPASGPTQSSHPTGATLDISKAPMGPAERNWMRSTLLRLKEQGYAYGIEERVQPTFHVMVFKNYGSLPKVAGPALVPAGLKTSPAPPRKHVRVKRAVHKHSRRSRR